MSLGSNAEVVECHDNNQHDIPLTNYHPVKLSSIEELDPETTIDVIVILRDVSDIIESVSKKDQRPLFRRVLHILDDTAATEITLWGDEAKAWNIGRKLFFDIFLTR